MVCIFLACLLGFLARAAGLQSRLNMELGLEHKEAPIVVNGGLKQDLSQTAASSTPLLHPGLQTVLLSWF